MQSKKIIRAVTVSMSICLYDGVIPDLQKQGYDVISLSSPGTEIEKLRADGVKCIEINMERHISLKKDIESLFQLVKVFRIEKPYMVHSMTPKAGLLCMLASWICRVPRRVHTFTGLIWPTETGLKRKVLMLTDWLTCFCATHIIPEGRGVMDDLHMHVTSKSMRVLGYGNVRGVDMEKFSRRSVVNEKAKSLNPYGIFTFVFVGRIVGDKGINELIEAFLQLLKKQYKTQLILIGEYEQQIDPISKLNRDRIKCTPEIHYVGSMFGDDLIAYYAASDCFVMPSYREGFPNTVLEAGAMGLPCIVTDINGSREIIEDGINGLIVPSKNADALCNAMEKMIVDSNRTKEMAKNARPMIESRFEQGFVKKCLLDFYDEIM